HELAAVVAEDVRDLRLRLGRALAEEREHTVLLDAEPVLLERLDRAHLDAVAHAREQKARAREELRRKRRLRCRRLRTRGGHGNSVARPIVGSDHRGRNKRLENRMNSQHSRKRWFALALIVAAQFMVVLDVAIVNVALPSIKTDLDFSQESLQWVITAYSIL